MQNNFYCHTCNIRLAYNRDYLECLGCQKRYPIVNDIPVFINDLNLCQMQNKQYTDEVVNKIFKPDDIRIPEEPYEKLSQQYFNRLGRDIKVKSVLDLGCGDGFLTFNLLGCENSIEEIYGLDVSLDALVSFKRNIQENKIDKRIVLFCSTAEKIFLPGNYFDAIVCRRFVHHLPLGPLLKEVYRLLKPGGFFICFREPYMNYLMYYLKKGYYTLINLISFIFHIIVNDKRYNRPIIFRTNTKKFLYSKADIQKLLSQEGFDMGVFSFSRFLFYLPRLIFTPFYIKFPSLRPHIRYILRLADKLDSNVFEKIIPGEFLQEVSFYSKKL